MLPVERLAWTLSDSGDPYRKWFAMFDAYFDASGHEADSPFVVVAGYIASLYQWKAFETHWKIVKDKFGIIGPFHAAAFMSYPRRDEFAKWEHGNPEADEFLKELIFAQTLYPVLSVSCIVNMEDYNAVDREYAIRDIFPPYALAARVCISELGKWSRDHQIAELECIFEDGDFGRGKFMELMRDEGHPIIPKFETKGKFGALQAADHLAWEQNKYLKNELKGKQIPPRESFNFLLTMPYLHVQFPNNNLLEYCKARGIEKRK